MKKLLLLVVLLSISAAAQTYTKNDQFVYVGAGTPSQNFNNTGIVAFSIAWSAQSTVFTCSVQVDSSADGVTWGNGDLIASQSCAGTPGLSSTATLAGGKNYVRAHVTVLTGNGGVNTTIQGYTSSGSATPAFSSVTAGTNTAALVIGSSGSLSTSGTGTITSTGVQSGSSLPATPCTVGTQFILTGPSSNNADRLYKCSGANGGSFWQVMQVSASASQDDFGVLGTTKWIGDGSITSGSAVMTCPNADCAFTAADIGKVCFASQAGTSNDGTILPIGTISVVTDSSHATCNGGNATGTNTTTALIVWGPDDDAALNAADAAVFAKCGQLHIHGMILIKSAKFKSIASTYVNCDTTNTYGSSGGTGHATVFGDGQTSTYLIPTPNFDFSTCTGNGGGALKSCIGPGGTAVAEFRSFTIDGFYTAGLVAGRTASLSLFADSFIALDMTIFGWCGSAACTSSAGCIFTNQATSASLGGCQNVGLIACYSGAAQVFLGPNWACEGTTNGFGMQVASGGTIKTINTFFSGSTNSVQVLSGGTWMSDFDEMGGGSTSNISNAGTIYMNRFNATNLSPNGWWPITNTATGKIFASNSNFNPASTNWINNATGAQFFDQGGNKFTGSAAGTCGVSCLNDSFSINQTACASGNFGFTSGWGTTAVTGTPTGNSQFCQFSIQTTVTGTAGPVLTYTFPQSFAGYGKVPNCTMTQVAGTFTLSNPSHSTTTTADTITFAGTPTATQTYTFVEQCR